MNKRARRRGTENIPLRFGTVAPTEKGISLDVSHKGISFECNSIPRESDIVILLEVENERHQLIGRIKWSRKQDSESLWNYVVGVEITQSPKEYNLMVQKSVYH